MCLYVLLHIRAEIVSHIPSIFFASNDAFPDQRLHVPSDVRARHDEPGRDIFPRDSWVLQNEAQYPALWALIKEFGNHLFQIGRDTRIDVITYSPGVLLGNNLSHPAQHTHMIPEGSDIHL